MAARGAGAAGTVTGWRGASMGCRTLAATPAASRLPRGHAGARLDARTGLQKDAGADPRAGSRQVFPGRAAQGGREQ
jgi:hypothetical protein